jgi:hypothetical protein
MVTSLFLILHHDASTLILHPTIVGTVVLISRPSHITPGRYEGTY